MDFPTLARACAPAVHISTLSAVVRHESGFDPLVIGVNASPHRSIRPKSRQEAVDVVRELMRRGVNFDVGYGQINVRNWKWLGVTPESIFDPCTNLAAAQRVLVDCYQRAVRQYGASQQALYAAFSCYNTGNLTDGFSNGYVSQVIAGAGLPVPPIARVPVPMPVPVPAPAAETDAKDDGTATVAQPGAFASPRADAFEAPRQDAFGNPAPRVFGKPVPAGRSQAPNPAGPVFSR
ncbi:lytic transglycosylase domain-containing protein [Bordetella bronchialis]|uniref:lytic transglycosylase domain-containing protein n=1 Tax=Bordetella bronchialis TaxID=463025 RepID=UPI003D0713E8